MQSQRELYERQIALERAELEAMPEEEAAELAAVYRAKGFTASEAEAIAERLFADQENALDTLIREELGLDPDQLGSPWRAAGGSFVAFADRRRSIPVIPFLFAAGTTIVVVSLVLSLVGDVRCRRRGEPADRSRSAIFSGLRQVAIGAAAADRHLPRRSADRRHGRLTAGSRLADMPSLVRILRGSPRRSPSRSIFLFWIGWPGSWRSAPAAIFGVAFLIVATVPGADASGGRRGLAGAGRRPRASARTGEPERQRRRPCFGSRTKDERVPLLDRLAGEGLAAQAWSNGPGERYAVHAHDYDKVIVVAEGSIAFGLPAQRRADSSSRPAIGSSYRPGRPTGQTSARAGSPAWRPIGRQGRSQPGPRRRPAGDW